jgi:hypothetical protein
VAKQCLTLLVAFTPLHVELFIVNQCLLCPSRRPRCRWEDNIGMDLRKAGWDCGMDSSGGGRDQWRGLVNALMIIGFHKRRGIS